MALVVDFYYGLGSRYSYLASTQIERIAADTGCRFAWHPMASGALMRLRGGQPFRGEPISGQYEWPYRQHDAEAWADYYGVPYREPVDFRADPDSLAVAATAAKQLGAVEPYSRRLFQAIFVEGRVIAEAYLTEFAAEVGLDKQAFRSHLDDPATAELYQTELRQARDRGAFGVPTFFLGEQMFWATTAWSCSNTRSARGRPGRHNSLLSFPACAGYPLRHDRRPSDPQA
jgi:2-hydroxychromene-2-carboxylate isomerase